ncbi:hypothetical protein H696_02376 [Fonticula alba]|uniref:Transcription factor TFIIIC triple barrel domain-containing protein n=1 Tax=Fonticula alba TaxID=691883 RepID=A0A058ZBY0_FONAL|nr:hypothetical protein H696_02376 [Fonticula alba]KCV71428.1 hypothetical protein H696_02376 [Fonticula alba]|eukprot:XP_009494551.1 hypothetical protein H696_02376 [Fonticula alba]
MPRSGASPSTRNGVDDSIEYEYYETVEVISSEPLPESQVFMCDFGGQSPSFLLSPHTVVSVSGLETGEPLFQFTEMSAPPSASDASAAAAATSADLAPHVQGPSQLFQGSFVHSLGTDMIFERAADGAGEPTYLGATTNRLRMHQMSVTQS